MRSVRRAWSAIQWPLLAALVIVALILGWFGFRTHGEVIGEPLGVLAAAYRSLQLFVLEFNVMEPPSAPAALQIARFLAPAVAGFAAFKALAILFREEIDRITLRWRRHHVIVCGSGSLGTTMADALLDADRKVAVIDLDPSLRTTAPMIVGDATDPDVLRMAGVKRASHVVALCGSDEANAAVALAVRRVTGAATRPVTHVHVVDPRLCEALRSEAISSGAPIEFFTVYEEGARTLLDRYPPRSRDGRPPAIAIVGFGRFGRSVLIEAVRRLGSVRIVAIDRQASAILEEIRRRRPGFGAGSDLSVIDIDVESPAFADAGFLTTEGVCDIDVVYVCLSDESDSLSTSLAIMNRLKELPSSSHDHAVGIVARVTRRNGLAELITESAGDEAGIRLHAFDLYRATLDERLLTGATREAIAAALHRDYLTSQEAGGRAIGAGPTLLPWSELSDDVKDANRAAAAGVGSRLRSIDTDVIPRAWTAEPITLTPAEVELLAILEHRRWLIWKLAKGFTSGEADFEAGTNPHLVPWSSLDEDAREWVRSSARALPRVLADAGQQVVRIDRGLARSVHRAYLRMREEAGDDPSANPSMVPWDLLSESLKASNRDQATHIRVKLLSIGYDIAPGDRSDFEFDVAQVEALGRLEHDRWVAQRVADGWVAGEVRDPDAKSTPWLVPWDDLSPEMQEIDREFVRSIPELLAESGQRIVLDPHATNA